MNSRPTTFTLVAIATQTTNMAKSKENKSTSSKSKPSGGENKKGSDVKAKGKKGTESKEPTAKESKEQLKNLTWQQKLAAVPLNDDNFVCSVTMFVEETVEHSEYLQEFVSAAALGRRRCVAALSYSDVKALIDPKSRKSEKDLFLNEGESLKGKESSKKGKESSKKIKDTPKKGKDSAKKKIGGGENGEEKYNKEGIPIQLLDEAEMHLGTGNIPTDIMAFLIKTRIMALKKDTMEKNEMLRKLADKIEEENKIICEKDDKIKEGKKGTGKNEKEDKKEKDKGGKKGKKKGEKGDGDAKIMEIETIDKKSTKLRKRGEEWRDVQYIEDFPVDGPDLYVALVGFYNPLLVAQLRVIGVPLNGLIKVQKEQTMVLDPFPPTVTTVEEPPEMEEEKDEEGLYLSPSYERMMGNTESMTAEDITDEQEMSDMLRVHMSQSGSFGLSKVYSENKHLNIFWSEIQKPEHNLSLRDIAMLGLVPQNFPYPGDDLETPSRDMVYDEISYVLYDLQDLKWQHKNYLQNMRTYPMGPYPKLPENEMEVYKTMVQLMPAECTSVHYILHCMLEQVVMFDAPKNPPPSPKHSTVISASSQVIYEGSNTDPETHLKLQLDLLDIHYGLSKCQVFKHDIEDPKIIMYGDKLHELTRQIQIPEIKIPQITIDILRWYPLIKLWEWFPPIDANEMLMYSYHISKLLDCMELDFLTLRLLRYYLMITVFEQMNCRTLNRLKSVEGATDEKSSSPQRSKSSLYSERRSSYICDMSSKSFCPPPAEPTDNEPVTENSCHDIKSLKDLFECPELVRLLNRRMDPECLECDVTGKEKQYSAYKMCHYVEMELLKPQVMLQVMQECVNKFNCTDYQYFKPTDTILIKFHNSEKENKWEDRWCSSLRTPVGLRDFNDYVRYEEEEWLNQQVVFHEKELQKKVESKPETADAAIELMLTEPNSQDIQSKLTTGSQNNENSGHKKALQGTPAILESQVKMERKESCIAEEFQTTGSLKDKQTQQKRTEKEKVVSETEKSDPSEDISNKGKKNKSKGKEEDKKAKGKEKNSNGGDKKSKGKDKKSKGEDASEEEDKKTKEEDKKTKDKDKNDKKVPKKSKDTKSHEIDDEENINAEKVKSKSDSKIGLRPSRLISAINLADRGSYSFDGYNVGPLRIEVSGASTIFYSPDGTNVKIERSKWLYGNTLIYSEFNKIGNSLSFYSYAGPPAVVDEPLLFHLVLNNGIILVFCRRSSFIELPVENKEAPVREKESENIIEVTEKSSKGKVQKKGKSKDKDDKRAKKDTRESRKSGDGSIIESVEAEKPPEPEKTTEAPLPTISTVPFNYDLHITLPNSLTIETVVGINDEDPFYIKQKFITKGPSCDKIRDESFRCYLRNGNVVIFKNDDTVEVLTPHSAIFYCREFNKPKPSKPTSTQTPPSTPMNIPLQIGDELSENNEKKQKKKGKSTPDNSKKKKGMKGKKENATEESNVDLQEGNKEDAIELEVLPPPPPRWEITDYEEWTALGAKYIVHDNIKQELENPLLVCAASDFEAGEIFTRRDDGTNTLLKADGSLTVSYPDGTRIVVTVEDLTVFEWTPQEIFEIEETAVQICSSKIKSSLLRYTESTLEQVEPSVTFSGIMENYNMETPDYSPTSIPSAFLTSESEYVLESYVFITVSVFIEHPNYASVKYNGSDLSAVISCPADLQVKVTSSGNYESSLGSKSVLNIQPMSITFEAYVCDDCSATSRTYISLKGFQTNTPNSIMSTTTDNWGNTFNVNYMGESVHYIPDEENTFSNDVCLPKIPTGRSRYLVLHRDLSGVEFTHFEDLQHYISLVERTALASHVVEPMPGKVNSLNCYTTFLPLKKTESGKWKMVVNKESHLPTRLTRKDLKRSTYGDPPDWLFAFPKQRGKSVMVRSLSSGTIQNIPFSNKEIKYLVYRMLHDLEVPDRNIIDSVQAGLLRYWQMAMTVYNKYQSFQLVDARTPSEIKLEEELFELLVTQTPRDVIEKYRLGLESGTPPSDEKITHISSTHKMYLDAFYKKIEGGKEHAEFYKKLLRMKSVPLYFDTVQGEAFITALKTVEESVDTAKYECTESHDHDEECRKIALKHKFIKSLITEMLPAGDGKYQMKMVQVDLDQDLIEASSEIQNNF